MSRADDEVALWGEIPNIPNAGALHVVGLDVDGSPFTVAGPFTSTREAVLWGERLCLVIADESQEDPDVCTFALVMGGPPEDFSQHPAVLDAEEA